MDSYCISMSMSSPATTDRKRLPYALIACDFCRRRKKRCDWATRDDGNCTQCIAAGHMCVKSLAISRSPSPAPSVASASASASTSTSQSSYSQSALYSPAPSPPQALRTYEAPVAFNVTSSSSTTYTFDYGAALADCGSRRMESLSFDSGTSTPPTIASSPSPSSSSSSPPPSITQQQQVASYPPWAQMTSYIPPAIARRGFPAPLDLIVHVTDKAADYFFTFFQTLNRGPYFYIEYVDEPAFRTEFELVANNVIVPDMSWALYVAAVLATASRMSGDVEYADYAAHVAKRVAIYFINESHNASFVYDWPVERRVIAYRGLLVLSYYVSAMNESAIAYSFAAQRIISDKNAADLIPQYVGRIAELMPHFTDAFQNVSTSTKLSQPSPEHINELTLSHRKYLKLKRTLCPYLFIGEGDHELSLGKEYDNCTDITDLLDTSRIKCELSAVNYYLTYSMSTGWDQPLSFDVYKALCILIKAEVVIKGFERVTVYGRKATLYQLIGNKQLAVHSARQTVACVVCLDSPTSVYPPFSLNFIRAVVILVEWDEGDEAAVLIKGGLHVLRKIAALWAGADAALQRLLAHLKAAIDDRERRITESLHDSRRALEREVLSCLNQQLRPELRAAAVQFARDAQQMEHIQHKRISVLTVQ